MATRECSKCGEVKPLAEFNKDKTKPLGLKTYCKHCHRASAKLYAQDKRHIYTARAAAWYRENKSRKQQYDSAYRPGYYWRAKTSINAKTNARRRRIRFASTPWTNDFFVREIYELASLRKQMTGLNWVVDHIVPISSPIVCGLHCESNLRIVLQSENLEKSNRWWPDMPIANEKEK